LMILIDCPLVSRCALPRRAGSVMSSLVVIACLSAFLKRR
jgi:hypothetical protein